MFRLLLIFTFISALVIGTISSIPLSFALRKSGLAERGLSWQQARGTIWNGQVTGLASEGLDIGTARIHSRWMDLLAGNPSSTLQISGNVFQGGMIASLSERGFNATNLSGNVNLAELPDIQPELRRIGGTLTIRKSSVSTGVDGTCKSASGEATLDIIQRVGIQHGRDWPILSGELKCDAGTFLIDFSGVGSAGAQFNVKLRVGKNGATQVEVRTANLDPEIEQLLPALGFTRTGDDFVLNQDTSRLN